jgi:2-keto-3-deoxy-L-rhamnonate aldolase RhmA
VTGSRGDDRRPLKQRLAAGEPLLGTFIRMPCAESLEACLFAGFDFVVVDGEHTPISDSVYASQVRAAEAVGGSALIRLPNSDPALLGRALESGAAGVHIPQVQDPEQARAAISAAKYAPEGVRGLSTNRGSGYGLRMSLDRYVASANRDGIVVLQIETASAIAQIEAIIAEPGCDVAFIRLTDLSLDLGVPGDYHHPLILDALEKARVAADSAGVVLGAPAASLEMAAWLVSLGVRYVTSNDIRLLTDAAVSMRAGFDAAIAQH